MAIYSLNHSTIGRSTHAAGTAAAHVRYVARPQAASVVLAEHVPADRAEAAAWWKEKENALRANARVADKLRLALPRELDAVQRADLVKDFVRQLGAGRVAWLEGVHDKGEDVHNPHCHLVLLDRDIETGKRVIGLSEKGSTERVRLAWERACNAALEAAGSAARVDRRSLAAQGVDRAPTIHVGPAVEAMAAKAGGVVSAGPGVTSRILHNWNVDARNAVRAEAAARKLAPQPDPKPAQRPQEAVGAPVGAIQAVRQQQAAQARQEAQEHAEAQARASGARGELQAAQGGFRAADAAERASYAAAQRTAAAVPAAAQALAGAERALAAAAAAQARALPGIWGKIIRAFAAAVGIPLIEDLAVADAQQQLAHARQRQQLAERDAAAAAAAHSQAKAEQAAARSHVRAASDADRQAQIAATRPARPREVQQVDGVIRPDDTKSRWQQRGEQRADRDAERMFERLPPRPPLPQQQQPQQQQPRSRGPTR
jgi:hypothetical protein